MIREDLFSEEVLTFHTPHSDFTVNKFLRCIGNFLFLTIEGHNYSLSLICHFVWLLFKLRNYVFFPQFNRLLYLYCQTDRLGDAV